MISTERTVRDVIVNAIKAIAQTKLGFVLPDGNVKDFLLDYGTVGKETEYLFSKVESGKRVRAIGVQVLSSESPGKDQGIDVRSYNITIRMYYEIDNGVGINTMIDHARAIREAINALHNNLSGTATLITQRGFLDSPQVQRGFDSEIGSILVGDMNYEYQKINPDY